MFGIKDIKKKINNSSLGKRFNYDEHVARWKLITEIPIMLLDLNDRGVYNGALAGGVALKYHGEFLKNLTRLYINDPLLKKELINTDIRIRIVTDKNDYVSINRLGTSIELFLSHNLSL